MSIPWNKANAAHLLRRAGFGGTREEVARAVDQGLDRTVRELFRRNLDQPDDLEPTDSTRELQAWWLRRMATSSSPLIEKLTLFWHNFFATGITKVKREDRMHTQNRTLRAGGLGRFHNLLLSMARDPAMLVWLDNRYNVVGNPNENWSRELMELFSTGVLDRYGQPNYTEFDVSEAARAFTGWGLRNGVFKFKPNKHDDGQKSFRGLTGNLDGTDILDNLAHDPATARRVTSLLWSYFAYPVDLDDPIVDELAATYQAGDTRIQPVLEQIFLHPEFYSQTARGALVKSPAEYMAGALHQLDAELDPDPVDLKKIANRTNNMGQLLFDPPSVFGWRGGTTWVEANGLLERARVAEWIADTRSGNGGRGFHYSLMEIVGDPLTWQHLTPKDVVDLVAETLGSVELEPATRKILEKYLVTAPDGSTVPFSLDLAVLDEKVRGLVALVLSSPEFQLA